VPRLFCRIALCMMEKPFLYVESTLKTLYYHILTYFKNTSKWSHFYMANTTDQINAVSGVFTGKSVNLYWFVGMYHLFLIFGRV
jgi:hypothetical protein